MKSRRDNNYMETIKNQRLAFVINKLETTLGSHPKYGALKQEYQRLSGKVWDLPAPTELAEKTVRPYCGKRKYASAPTIAAAVMMLNVLREYIVEKGLTLSNAIKELRFEYGVSEEDENENEWIWNIHYGMWVKWFRQEFPNIELKKKNCSVRYQEKTIPELYNYNEEDMIKLIEQQELEIKQNRKILEDIQKYKPEMGSLKADKDFAAYEKFRILTGILMFVKEKQLPLTVAFNRWMKTQDWVKPVERAELLDMMKINDWLSQTKLSVVPEVVGEAE
jgi:hypothetical protein